MSSHSGKYWLIQGKPKDNSVGPWNHISPLQWAEGLGFETSALGNFLAEHLAHICVRKSKTAWTCSMAKVQSGQVHLLFR